MPCAVLAHLTGERESARARARERERASERARERERERERNEEEERERERERGKRRRRRMRRRGGVVMCIQCVYIKRRRSGSLNRHCRDSERCVSARARLN